MTSTRNTTLIQKGKAFAALHQAPGIFEILNPWDIGSALMLEKLGAKALATSSGASAMVMGLTDGRLGRDAVLEHGRQLAAATQVPVAADLENAFAHDPAGVAQTFVLAAQTGLVGGSLEDFGGKGYDDAHNGIYSLDLAVARVKAAAEVTRNLPFPFLLTARAENHLRGVTDLADTITRLRAYEAAGADALFAPALPDLASIQAVCSAVKVPVNFMVGIAGKSFSRVELAAAGVKRISFGTVLYRKAMATAQAAAREALEGGTYGFV